MCLLAESPLDSDGVFHELLAVLRLDGVLQNASISVPMKTNNPLVQLDHRYTLGAFYDLQPRRREETLHTYTQISCVVKQVTGILPVISNLGFRLFVVFDERITLHETCTAIKRQLHLLDFPVLGENVIQVCVPFTGQLVLNSAQTGSIDLPSSFVSSFRPDTKMIQPSTDLDGPGPPSDSMDSKSPDLPE